MREKTGGAAFPTPRFMVDDESRILGFSIHTDGMSLRDYFAAKAMQAFESRQDLDDIPALNKANRCYRIADAMLKAREE
jgi:hypothetical protein